MPTTNDIYQQEYAMLSPEETDTLYKRIELHRFHLSTFLNQKTMFGDAHVPPVLLLGIRDNRNSIQHLKDILRGEELEVNDQADDFDPVAQVTSTATPPPVVISEEELEDLWLQAEEAFKKYDWEKAEPLLVQVASANPRFREVQRLLSRTKKNLGLLAEYRRLCALDDNQWREAKTKFDFIRRESQNFPDSQNLLGWIELQEWCGNLYELAEEYLSNGNLIRARELLTHILERHPDNRPAIELLELVAEIEEEEASRQRQEEFLIRQAQEKEAWRIRNKQEAVWKDVKLALGIIVVLVILIVIVSNMAH
jgi:tetratricopeptide (TPR) repeat protein